MHQLVDYLFELTKRVVVMDGHKYVYLDDLKEVSLDIINQAVKLQDNSSDNERIRSIKGKAGEIIKSKYTIEWQLNHPRVDAKYINEYNWIDNIRRISNESELNLTSLEDINWGI